jgi:hypothetical protein
VVKKITARSRKRSFQESELDLELKRVLFEFTDSLVSVKFNSKFSGFEFLGVKIPTVSEGSRVELPYFLAEKLFQEKLIEDFSDSFPLSLQDLTMAVRKEVRQGEVQPIYPFLYTLFNHRNTDNTSEASHYTEIEMNRQKDRMNQLSSEYILMQKIHSIVDNWKKVVIKDELEGMK